MPKQTELPGVERPVNKRVAAVGEKHADAIAAATKANTKRKETKHDLVRVMREEGVEQYVDMDAKPPIVIDLTNEPKIKISKYKGKVDNDDEVKAKKRNMRVVKNADDDDSDGDEMPN